MQWLKTVVWLFSVTLASCFPNEYPDLQSSWDRVSYYVDGSSTSQNKIESVSPVSATKAATAYSTYTVTPQSQAHAQYDQLAQYYNDYYAKYYAEQSQKILEKHTPSNETETEVDEGKKIQSPYEFVGAQNQQSLSNNEVDYSNQWNDYYIQQQDEYEKAAYEVPSYPKPTEAQNIFNNATLQWTAIAGSVLAVMAWATVSGWYWTINGVNFFGKKRRSMPGNSFDFSHLNILDWISMAEEMYRNYDTKNSDCYKRLICETYKNKKLGGVARTLDTAARWISFLEIIRYSDLFSEFFDEARDAIDRGKGSDKCSELYDTCDFSLSRIMHKYFDHNNIGEEQNVEYL